MKVTSEIKSMIASRIEADNAEAFEKARARKSEIAKKREEESLKKRVEFYEKVRPIVEEFNRKVQKLQTQIGIMDGDSKIILSIDRVSYREDFFGMNIRHETDLYDVGTSKELDDIIKKIGQFNLWKERTVNEIIAAAQLGKDWDSICSMIEKSGSFKW